MYTLESIGETNHSIAMDVSYYDMVPGWEVAEEKFRYDHAPYEHMTYSEACDYVDEVEANTDPEEFMDAYNDLVDEWLEENGEDEEDEA